MCTYEQNKKRGRKTFDEDCHATGASAGVRCSATAEIFTPDLRIVSTDTNPMPVIGVPATQNQRFLLSPTERVYLRTVFDFTNRLMTLGM